MTVSYSKKHLIILIRNLLITFCCLYCLNILFTQQTNKNLMNSKETLFLQKQVLSNLQTQKSTITRQPETQEDYVNLSEKIPNKLQLQQFLKQLESSENRTSVHINKINALNDSILYSTDSTDTTSKLTIPSNSLIKNTTYTVNVESRSILNLQAFLKELESSKRLIQVSDVAYNVSQPDSQQIIPSSNEQIIQQLEGQDEQVPTKSNQPMEKTVNNYPVKASITMTIYESSN